MKCTLTHPYKVNRTSPQPNAYLTYAPGSPDTMPPYAIFPIDIKRTNITIYFSTFDTAVTTPTATFKFQVIVEGIITYDISHVAHNIPISQQTIVSTKHPSRDFVFRPFASCDITTILPGITCCRLLFTSDSPEDEGDDDGNVTVHITPPMELTMTSFESASTPYYRVKNGICFYIVSTPTCADATETLNLKVSARCCFNDPSNHTTHGPLFIVNIPPISICRCTVFTFDQPPLPAKYMPPRITDISICDDPEFLDMALITVTHAPLSELIEASIVFGVITHLPPYPISHQVLITPHTTQTHCISRMCTTHGHQKHTPVPLDVYTHATFKGIDLTSPSTCLVPEYHICGTISRRPHPPPQNPVIVSIHRAVLARLQSPPPASALP